MAIIGMAETQIRDLNDPITVQSRLDSNLAKVQFLTGNGEYNPNYTNSPVIISPSLYVVQQNLDIPPASEKIKAIRWFYKLGSDTTWIEIESTNTNFAFETIGSKNVKLKIIKNIMNYNNPQLDIKCELDYKEEYMIEPYIQKVEISYSLSVQGNNGDDAYTVLMTNENHTIMCDSNGLPKIGEIGNEGRAKTEFKVFRGTNELTPTNSTSPTTNNFFVRAKTVPSGVTMNKMPDNKTFYLDGSAIPESGKVVFEVTVNGMSTKVEKEFNFNKTKDGESGGDAYVAVLSNDSHSIPTDPEGNNGNYTGCQTTINLYRGSKLLTEGVTYSFVPSDGIDGYNDKENFSGEEIIIENSSSGNTENTVILGKTKYKKSDGSYIDIWENGATLESCSEAENNKISILSHGKNINNIKDWVNGSWSGGTGMFETPPTTVNKRISSKEKSVLLTQNEITFSGKEPFNVAIRYYDADNNFIPGIIGFLPNKTTIPPKNAKYYNLIVAKQDTNQDIDINWFNNLNLQMEEGTQSTPYEPYKEDKKDILLPQPLRSVKDKYRDRVISENGKYYLEKIVGVRQYQSGDESNNEVMTDKTNTYYKLSIPEKILLENISDINISTFAKKTYIEPSNSIKPTLSFFSNVVKENSLKNTFTVKNLTTDIGFIDCKANYSGSSYTRRFTVTKQKSGSGENATAYWLVTSTSAIAKDKQGAYNPKDVIFTAKSQTGNASPIDYLCRFKIEETLNNETWIQKYISSQNESSKTYIPSVDIKALRVTMYATGGTANKLDEQIIPIVADGTDGQNAKSIEIVGQQVFKTDASGTTTPSQIVLNTSLKNITGIVQWQRKSGSSWINLATGVSTTITPSSTGWIDNQYPIRAYVVGQEDVYDEFTLYKVIDGKNTMVSYIHAPYGTVIKNHSRTSLDLQGNIFWAGEDKSTLSTAKYKWEKQEGNGSWTVLREFTSGNTGRNIIINEKDIPNMLVVRCTFQYDGQTQVDTIVLTDQNDPYQITISSTAGYNFKNGQIDTHLIANIHRNAIQLDVVNLYNTIPPTSNFQENTIIYVTEDDKYRELVSGQWTILPEAPSIENGKSDYTYTWYKIDGMMKARSSGEVVENQVFFGNGKIIRVTNRDVQNIANFRVVVNDKY